jgi:hypothetical protein
VSIGGVASESPRLRPAQKGHPQIPVRVRTHLIRVDVPESAENGVLTAWWEGQHGACCDSLLAVAQIIAEVIRVGEDIPLDVRRMVNEQRSAAAVDLERLFVDVAEDAQGAGPRAGPNRWVEQERGATPIRRGAAPRPVGELSVCSR